MSKIYVEVTALATYYNDELVNAVAIADSEADACASYKRELIGLGELAPALVQLYGKNEAVIGRILTEFLSGKHDFITLSGPAALLPCIGRVRVECQTKFIEWGAA